jgi:hypothetical protein
MVFMRAEFPRIGKTRQAFFQALEAFAENFPSLGKSQRSEVRNQRSVFRGLESGGHHGAEAGKKISKS